MRTKRAAFTLAEAMIAMAGSVIVIGALLFSSIHLQRCLHSAEQTAGNQADQRRLLDYVARDLRRAIGIATTTSAGGLNGQPVNGANVTVENDSALVVTIPGYYQSQTPGDAAYDQPYGVVGADNYVDYGTTDAGHAPGVQVLFRKQFEASENCICFVRIEANNEAVIVREADNLHLTLNVDPDGKTCTVIATVQSPKPNTPVLTEREDVLLRNIRMD
jgi:hypothetical protein